MSKIETVKRAKAHTVYKLKDGTRVPGVTTVIGELDKGRALLLWANRVGKEGYDLSTYVDALAEIGKTAHAMIAAHLAGKKITADLFQDASADTFDRASNSFLKYLEFEKQTKPKVVLSEAAFVSEEFQFGGTVDAVMEFDGVLTLVDFKTSKGLFLEHRIQVCAYARLLQENGYDVKAIRLLRIGRTPDEGFEDHRIPMESVENHWRIFYHARAIYDFKKMVKNEN